MKYRQKAEKFKELLWSTNIKQGYSGVERLRWSTKEEFSRYMESIGGRVKEDTNRRKKCLVLVVRETYGGTPRVVAEFPMDFVDKALALGFLP